MPYSSGHVRNHCRLLARHFCPDCPGFTTSLESELFSIHVRAAPSFDLKYILTLIRAFMHLGSGIAVGVAGLAAGYCIGVVGENGVRAYMEQSRIFVGMVLVLIFGEVLGLYGYVTCPLAMFFFGALFASRHC